MLRSILSALSAPALLVTLGGAGYLAFALVRALTFRRRIRGGGTPSMTVLKPIKGVEAGLFENLCSFCDQDYPVYQIIFGIADRNDPAIDVVQRVLQRFPNLDLRLVVAESPAVSNPKVGNLQNMMPFAKHDVIVIADADMRVGNDYLRALAAGFANDRAGAVTCLYAGDPCEGVPSELGAMYINDHFAPSVLVAQAVEKLTYCFGATMAVRRAVLDEVGGLAALASHLGDDYMLGKLVSDRGYNIVLSHYVVRNVVFESSFQHLWHHELRWGRTVRAQRPAGYASLFITYPLPFALLFTLTAAAWGGALWGLALIAVVLVLRVALHYAMRRAFSLRDRSTPWLIPVRDILGLVVWVASLFGRSVRWRDLHANLESGGRLA